MNLTTLMMPTAPRFAANEGKKLDYNKKASPEAKKRIKRSGNKTKRQQNKAACRLDING